MEDSAGMTPRPGCQVRGMISFPRTWKGAGSFVIGSPQDTVSCFLPTTGQRFCWAVKPTEKIKSNLFLPSFYSAAWPPPRPPPPNLICIPALRIGKDREGGDQRTSSLRLSSRSFTSHVSQLEGGGEMQSVAGQPWIPWRPAVLLLQGRKKD